MTDHSCGAPHSCGGQHHCGTSHDHGAASSSHDAGSHGQHQHHETSDAGSDMATLLMLTALNAGATKPAAPVPLGHGARRSGAMPRWVFAVLVAMIFGGAFVLWINFT